MQASNMRPGQVYGGGRGKMEERKEKKKEKRMSYKRVEGTSPEIVCLYLEIVKDAIL